MWFDIRGDVLNGSSLLNPFRKGNIKRAPLLRKTEILLICMYCYWLYKCKGSILKGVLTHSIFKFHCIFKTIIDLWYKFLIPIFFFEVLEIFSLIIWTKIYNAKMTSYTYILSKKIMFSFFFQNVWLHSFFRHKPNFYQWI